MRKHPIMQMVAIGLVASAIGIALGLWIDWFPTDAAKQGEPIDTLYDVLMIVSVPIFVLVATVVLYSAWRFRMRPGQEKEDGPPIHGNTRLEVIWTAVPAILLVSLCSYAYAVLTDIEEKQPDELVVNVRAVQFAWSYAYPQDGGRAVSSTELVLPKDRPVHFRIRTEDVIHDFWVPAFRMKIDAVPGITTEIRVTPTKLGRFPVVCAELCGLGHATMRSTVRVVTPERFEQWLADQGRPAAAADGGGGNAGGDPVALGRQTFADAGCAGCHTLADAGSTASTGPDLDDVVPGLDAAQLRTAIVDPDAEVTSGFAAGLMPGDYGERLSQEQIDGLVAYLQEVTG